ncbi:MAG: helix-hairpin-helix domain-containing protein [Fulvivirga sp.]
MGRKVNLNEATVEDIIKNIEGIDKDTAETIIHYRNNNGTIVSIDDLRNIYGFDDVIERMIRERAVL